MASVSWGVDSFFGRYLDGGVANLTGEEVGYLHGKGCAVLPVYRKGPVGGIDMNTADHDGVSAMWRPPSR